MSHDYDPNWDYPCIELEEVADLTDLDRKHINDVVDRLKVDLAPGMGFTEGFEVFYAEHLGLCGNNEAAVAVFCSGTNSRPVIGFDLAVMRDVAESEGLNFIHQFELSIAHELGHAYQESCGHDHDHAGGLNEDDAEQFGIAWADHKKIELWRLNSELPKPDSVPKKMAPG